MKELVPLLVGVPLGTAFLVAVLAHIRGLGRLTGALATLAVAANLLMALWLWSAAAGQDGPSGEPEVWTVWAGRWDGEAGRPVGIQLVWDGLSRFMVIVVNFVAFAAIVFSAAYMRRFTKVWLFHTLFLLMTGAMIGVVLAGDLFNLYVFIEVAAIASYGLVAFGTGREELEAAFKYLVLGVVASAFILVGITILYSLTGQLNMAMVADRLQRLGMSPAVLLAAACLLGGLALKAAMVPFHSWLPDAHPSAPAPISAMLSGVLIKTVGVYAMARIVFNVLGVSPFYANVLIVMGVLSMVVGMLLAVGQWDLKRLLAYSSISQAGYIVLALGVAASLLPGDRKLAGLCLFGGLFHLFNHAAFKGLLFLCSGSIEQATGTRQLREMGGLTRRMPVTGWCCRIGALSIAGVPPFNGFFSKIIIILALALAGRFVLCAIAVAVAVGTLLMYIKVQRYALDGEPGTRVAAAGESHWTMGAGMALLAVACVVAGVALSVGPLKEHLLGPAGEALISGVKRAGGLAMGGG
jgi:multicomponent Na+:H+ antiporter subunit D